MGLVTAIRATLSTPEPPALDGWRFPFDVKGWLTEGEGKALARLAAGKIVLEVGSYHGRSTVAMAQTAKHVISIDHHKGDPASGPGGTLAAFLETVVTWGVGPKVTNYVLPFEDVEFPPNSFDLVFIDAAHDRASVARDAKKALACVKPGGVIAFHDWGRFEVMKGAGDVFLTRPVGIAETLAWFQPTTTAVMIGIPTRGGGRDQKFHECLHAACATAGCLVELKFNPCAHSVVVARNGLVADFLNRPHLTHLLMVDDDVFIPPHTVADLLLADADVAGGCVPSVKVNEHGTALYIQAQRFRTAEWLRTWPASGEIFRAEVVGGGCMLIKRSVFECLGFPWFRWPEQYGEGEYGSVSDDSDFCFRVQDAGLTIKAHGGVRCGHRKLVDVGQFILEG
jgi:SAM-dependent methyltransferase